MTTKKKKKIVILGGGVGGVTVAHQLSRPGWKEHFESITLYQRGWRLGGKGASGRNREAYDRIEEHGLHIWLGFYENAFRMMRECYEELNRPSGARLRTVDEAFERSSSFVVMEQRPQGWLAWPATFPSDDTMPGEAGTPLPSPWEYVLRALQRTWEMLSSMRGMSQTSPPPAPVRVTPLGPAPSMRVRATPVPPPLSTGVASMLGDMWDWATNLVETTAESVIGAALAVASALQVDPGQHRREDHDRLLALIDLAADLARKQLPPTDQLSDKARREWYLADVMMACVRGVLRHGLLTAPSGLDAIDDFDFSDWLIHHGADPESARSGLVITTVYDLQFAYAEGDPARPSCSAAAALRGLARLFFTYNGAIAWKMRAGMGDVVFAPLYDVLHKRGVEFRFFHRVDALRLSADRSRIGSIEIGRQVDLVHPEAEYEPLVDVGGMRCWPNQPLTDQLVDAAGIPPDEFETIWHSHPDSGSETLIEGEHFDEVVLAIPVGAHPFVCADLIADNPAWKRMSEELGTVYTQAFQLWLSVTMEELGCTTGPATTGGYLEPFDTYADMRQLILAENWLDSSVEGIAYFCNAMPTPEGRADPAALDTQARANEEVRKNAVRFLRRRMAELWPAGVQRYPTDFRWELLVGDDAKIGPDRFKDQFWRANVDPSERYVLPLPGTARYRLHPAESGYDNLFLAGDWTLCGINAGCVEAAVISGMLAANAISGYPSLSDIVGYGHW